MNRFLLFAIGLILPFLNCGQATSTCNVPPILYDNYELDIKQMAIARMHQVAPGDLVHIRIPQVHIDDVSGRLAAVFNTIQSIPESDSVFNIYCVHDANDSYQLTGRVLLRVDTNVAWTQAWRNLIITTGNTFIDDLMTRYNLILEDYYDWSFGHYALLSSDSIWNDYALIDSMIMDSGLISGSIDNLIGGAGKIQFSENAGIWIFDFYFEFNDCFDGCDNYRKWSFRVNPDCSVNYLGFNDWGVFGTSPLPPSINCNLTTAISGKPEKNRVRVFPIPVLDQLTFQWDQPYEEVVVEIFDVSGKLLVRTERDYADMIRVFAKDLSSGVYLYGAIHEKKISTGKFLKQ
jgi:hypothetical protein